MADKFSSRKFWENMTYKSIRTKFGPNGLNHQEKKTVGISGY